MIGYFVKLESSKDIFEAISEIQEDDGFCFVWIKNESTLHVTVSDVDNIEMASKDKDKLLEKINAKSQQSNT